MESRIEYIEITDGQFNQLDSIAFKFASEHPIGVTVIIPSGNELNKRIAEVFMSNCNNAELIEGVICKLTTEEVDDIVLLDFGSKFREHYKEQFNAAYEQLWEYLEDMNEMMRGTYSRLLIKDPEMRDVLDMTLKVSQNRFANYANKINGQNILIVDDSISSGQTAQEACRIMQESYAPKSITVLKLV
jgi:phosphoribosylpyrophosphate synthetase